MVAGSHPFKSLHGIRENSLDLEFEILRLDVSRPMHYAKNNNLFRIRSVVDASLPIRQSPQTRRDMVAGRSCEIHLCNPRYFRG